MHGLASRLHPPRDPGNSDICLKAAAGGEAQPWLGQARLGGRAAGRVEWVGWRGGWLSQGGSGA